MKQRLFKNMDYGILVCTVILLVIGLVAPFIGSVNKTATSRTNIITYKIGEIFAILS